MRLQNNSRVDENHLYKQEIKKLKIKYGTVPGPYFLKKDGFIKNRKISRLDEGLFIHHIFENQIVDEIISNIDCNEILKIPYAFHLEDNLVYCNFIEHLELHYLICLEAKKANIEDFTVLCQWINDWIYHDKMKKYKSKQHLWRNKAMEIIKTNFDEYISILQKMYKLTIWKKEIKGHVSNLWRKSAFYDFEEIPELKIRILKDQSF